MHSILPFLSLKNPYYDDDGALTKWRLAARVEGADMVGSPRELVAY